MHAHLRVHGLQAGARLRPLLCQPPHAQLLLLHHLAKLPHQALGLLQAQQATSKRHVSRWQATASGANKQRAEWREVALVYWNNACTRHSHHHCCACSNWESGLAKHVHLTPATPYSKQQCRKPQKGAHLTPGLAVLQRAAQLHALCCQGYQILPHASCLPPSLLPGAGSREQGAGQVAGQASQPVG